MSHSVLPLLPAQTYSVGPCAGLLEDGQGAGVVFVFDLATYSFAAHDELGRRLAAVQLTATEVASVAEVASAFGIDTSTL